MNITSEYIYNNPKLDEINSIIEKTWLEYDLIYGLKWGSQVRIICNFKFFDKIDNRI